MIASSSSQSLSSSSSLTRIIMLLTLFLTCATGQLVQSSSSSTAAHGGSGHEHTITAEVQSCLPGDTDADLSCSMTNHNINQETKEEEHSDEAGSKKCIKSDSVTAQQQIQTPYEWDDIGQALLVQGHIGTYYDIGYNITSISISDNGDNIALGITVCAHIPDDSKKGKDININSKVKVFRRVSRHGKEKWVQRGKDLKGFGNIVSLSNNGKVLGIGNDHDNNADHNKRSQWFDGGLITMFQYRKKIDDWFSMGSVHHGGAASSLFGSSASLPENYKRMAVGPAGHDGFDVTEAGSVRIYQRLFQNKTLQHSRDIIL